MSTVRERRLTKEYAELEEYARLHPRVRIAQVEGSPPERYEIEYRISSLVDNTGSIKVSKEHIVEVAISRNFPRTPPKCRMLTSVFHPNIDSTEIHLDEHWSSETSLVSLVIRIGEMLSYQRYHIASAVNPAAVEWIKTNIDQLPLDEIDLHDVSQAAPSVNPDNVTNPQAKTPPSLTALAAEPIPDSVKLTCPECGASYYVRENANGKEVQCKKCRKTFLVEL